MLIKTNIMDGKIYDLLKKIDDFKIEKFGLDKENRILLKRLLLDEDFLNEFIKKISFDGVVDFLTNIYNALFSISTSINDIKLNSKSDEKLKEIIESSFDDDLERIEHERESALDGFIKKEIEQNNYVEKIKNIEKSDQEKYQEILNNLKK